MMLPLLPIQHTCLLLGPTSTTLHWFQTVVTCRSCCLQGMICLLLDHCPALLGQRACCEQPHLVPTYNPPAP